MLVTFLDVEVQVVTGKMWLTLELALLSWLTRVSQNCEQFIKFECNNDIVFIENSYAWWVSRDGTRMNYWGGATGYDNMCACGVTNSCSNGNKCNCYNSGSGWREDSGLLTDKSALPVTQIRLGDLDSPSEEGYHTLGKLKCYGQAWWTYFATNTARLSKGISFRPVLTLAQNISVKIRHACYMRRLSDVRLKHTETLMAFWIKFHQTFLNRNFFKVSN